MGNNRNKKVNDKEENNDSFLQKMKNDKKFSAKVQLIGYGIFILALVIYVNISSLGGNRGIVGNIISHSDFINNGSNIDKNDNSLLKRLRDNYSYEISVKVGKNSLNVLTNENVVVDENILYSGKNYDKYKEINKMVNDNKMLYYKVDNNYYVSNDNVITLVKDSIVYDVVSFEYLELDKILKLIDKASLDHVTDYSSGRKESVYHLMVKDVVVNHQKDDVVEIKVEEDNGVLKLNIDYSNLFVLIDDSIVQCNVEVIVKQIGEVEKFEVIVSNGENASLE